MKEPLRSRIWSATLPLSSEVALRSLWMAAFSLSAHSERLRNSKASGMCSTTGSKGSGLRAEPTSVLDKGSDRGRSSAVSLNLSREAATLRPIAGL